MLERLNESLDHLERHLDEEVAVQVLARSRRGPELLRTMLSEDGTRADAELWIPVERASD